MFKSLIMMYSEVKAVWFMFGVHSVRIRCQTQFSDEKLKTQQG